MHTPHPSQPTQPTRTARRIAATLVTVSMVATVVMAGLAAPPAQAQGAAQFVFEGAGWGHGVGMSQNGARNAANGGVDHVGILNFYYPNTIVSQVAPLDTIRVHLGDASTVELSSSGSITFERGGVAINAIPSGSISVSAHDGGLQIGNAWTTGSPSDPLYVTFPQPVKISNNGHRYLWGRIQLTNKNGKVRVVEVLPLEQYVAGIAEMPAAWPLEALMAQAIAARTYAHEITLHRRNSAEWAQEYDISGSTVDQNYIGYDAQDSAWDQKWLAAVSATAGVEVVDSNGPIRAYYSASNGGYTETAAYVFDNDVAYTVAAPDPFDEGGHDWTTWTRTYSQESMSRWLNAYPDTSVGTLTAINVLGGHGASARLDKAVVELVGTGGTKRVTGRRLMVVMNAGIFAEGGGLSTHLPGTFTTIGNGISAGPPAPSGTLVVASVTPDPVAKTLSVNAGYTPPPGWKPEPGTGVPPGSPVAPASESDADDGTAADGTSGNSVSGDGVSGDGVSGDGADGSTAVGSGTARYTPPPGWQPEPGTGVPPGTPVAPTSATTSANGEAGSTGTDGTAASDSVRYSPPAGWQPEPGTGVPPGVPVAPTRLTTSGSKAETTTTGSADAMPAEPTASTSAGSTSGTQQPAPAASATAAPSAHTDSAGTGSSAEDSTEFASLQVARADGAYQPPAGWQPEPGSGVAPGASATAAGFVGGTGGGDASSTGVFLVTRSGGTADSTETRFEVIAPTDELAAESRSMLAELQARSAAGVFGDFDIDGYIASVAPRPVHAMCTAASRGITCVPLSSLSSDN